VVRFFHSGFALLVPASCSRLLVIWLIACNFLRIVVVPSLGRLCIFCQFKLWKAFGNAFSVIPSRAGKEELQVHDKSEGTIMVFVFGSTLCVCFGDLTKCVIVFVTGPGSWCPRLCH
jgi:hypothetical protein